jgi:hypothetical protein
MTRTRPRRWRNCFRDAQWMRAVVRSWAARLGHVDLERDRAIMAAPLGAAAANQRVVRRDGALDALARAGSS